MTGSQSAGRVVAARAGKSLKKTVLELGGSDPYIILEDADLEKTVESCVASRLLNSGQSCIAAKRFVVVEAVRKRFEELLVAKMEEKKMGRSIGRGYRDRSSGSFGFAGRSSPSGCAKYRKRCTLSIGRPDACRASGAFYPPTVLGNVQKGMPAYDEETFGPVAAVIAVEDEAEAIRTANDTDFGLGAAVFTSRR